MQRPSTRVEYVSALDYEKQFRDKVCLVTGATSGIGKSVCRKLIRAGTFERIILGANVIMIGRTMQKIEKVLMEFKAQGLPISEGRIHAKNMDFNEPSNVEKDFQNVG